MEHILFVGKKIISKLVYPVGAVLALWVAGLIVRRYRPKSSAGTILILFAGIMLAAFASPLTSYVLLRPLESWAGPYADPDELARKGVSHIVVLAGIAAGKGLSPADRWGTGIFRVMEGARLCRGVRGSRLVLLQPGFLPQERLREQMAALPEEMGISAKDLVLEEGAWDTFDEALIIKRILGDQPFALVTSAYHMPRALQIFRRARLNPIPAPCEYMTAVFPNRLEWIGFDGVSIARCQFAIHEYIGIIWLEARNYVQPGSSPP